MKITTRKTWTLLALLAFPAPNALAQDTQDEPEIPGLNPLRPVAEEGPQQEMQRLFAEVERRLRAIDGLLVDASAGDTAKLDELEESGIEELIREASPTAAPTGVGGVMRASQGQGQRVLSGIDRIIEIAEQMGGQCNSPGNSSSSSEGESPLDNRGEQRTDKSQSPEDPKEGAPQPKPGDGEPKNNKGSDDPGDLAPAQKPPASEVEATPVVIDDRDHWGDLPVHHRDIFRAEGGKKLPAQYRDWIDSYYRRLNARAND